MDSGRSKGRVNGGFVEADSGGRRVTHMLSGKAATETIVPGFKQTRQGEHVLRGKCDADVLYVYVIYYVLGLQANITIFLESYKHVVDETVSIPETTAT